VWLVVGVYVSCAVLSRTQPLHGYEGLFGNVYERDGAFSGASVLVTFMVVFYLGYCYNRHFEQYAALRDAMSTLVDVMINARVTLSDAQARTVYCYVNLLHATAYVGMTPALNSANFLDRFIVEHDLAPSPFLQEKLRMMDVEHSGGRSFNVCAGWLIQLFHDAHKRHELDGESYRTMHEEVLKARSLLNSLYAYQHQVIPFVYSHLVSLSCFFYLAFLGVEKGARFTPDSSYVFGAAVPAASFFIALVTTLGLVEIGQAISDPFSGDDREDFALPSFLKSCADLTFHVAFSSHMCAPHIEEAAAVVATKQESGTGFAEPSVSAPPKPLRRRSVSIAPRATEMTGTPGKAGRDTVAPCETSTSSPSSETSSDLPAAALST